MTIFSLERYSTNYRRVPKHKRDDLLQVSSMIYQPSRPRMMDHIVKIKRLTKYLKYQLGLQAHRINLDLINDAICEKWSKSHWLLFLKVGLLSSLITIKVWAPGFWKAFSGYQQNVDLDRATSRVILSRGLHSCF
jgi:hypothetical protein